MLRVVLGIGVFVVKIEIFFFADFRRDIVSKRVLEWLVLGRKISSENRVEGLRWKGDCSIFLSRSNRKFF